MPGWEFAPSRFWRKVRRTDTCWLWIAATNSSGYGCFRIAAGRLLYAHRYAYELAVGPIADGMVLDHLCNNRRCVNPDHMEVVTLQENARRGSRRRHPTAQPIEAPVSLF